MARTPVLVEGVSNSVGQMIHGACFLCPNNACGSLMHVVDGTIVKVLPKMNPHNLGKMCAKGMSVYPTLYSPYRVTKPLVRRSRTKGLGVDAEWGVIRWDDAFNLVAERLKDLRRTDPRRFAFFCFKTAHMTYYAAYTAAFGSPNFRPFSASLFCGNNVHSMTYMVHGTFHDAPDLDYCKYLITFGTQYSSVGGIDTMYSAQKVPEARRRGMKLVVVDPIQSPAAARADQWIPIRPGTDLVLILGIANQLLNEYRIFDADFLKFKTNAPYLVSDDERYVRDRATGKPLVWDPVDNKPKPYDGDVKDYALTGSYEVDGVKCRPGFELVAEGIRKWTPENVEDITTVPASTVRALAREYGEAASIGSTISIEGHVMPYRPVAVHWYRGLSAHKNSTLAGFAASLLKLIVGAVDVPGGSLGEPYEDGYSMEGPDGLLTTSPHAHGIPPPYPPRKCRRPESLWSFELFPTAAVSESMMPVSYLYPDRFPLPYKMDMLFQHHTNIAKTSLNPQQMSTILTQIPFQVSFSFEIDETAEFADVVIPALHNLETLTPIANTNNLHPGMHEKYFLASFPAAKPPFDPPYDQATDIMDYLLEIAHRADFLDDVYSVLNAMLRLKEDNLLDAGVRYSWSEIADRFLKSKFGDEHDLEWFQRHGLITLPRRIEEAYPGAFKKPRIPFYFEFMAKARKDLKETTANLGYKEWDLSAYRTVPDWHPCPSHVVSDPKYDLFLVNRKSGYLVASVTGNNPLLDRLVVSNKAYDIIIHKDVASRKDIRDGDIIWVQSWEGIRDKGRAKLSETIHPEAIVSTGVGGFWAKGTPVAQGKGFDFNKFLFVTPDKIDFGNGAFDSCIKVKVWRAEKQVL